MKINSGSRINFGVQYKNSINNIMEDSLVFATKKGEQALKSWREAKKTLNQVAPAYSLYIFDDEINNGKEEPIRYSLPERYYVECGQLYSDDRTLPWRSITPVTLKKDELITTEKLKKLISFFQLLEKIDTLKEQEKSPKRNEELKVLRNKLDEIQNEVKKRLDLKI